mmetsp:Transcript_11027/g.31635  ORF Transcript_11027/g.31635 Transcript_11027/m.31635 type:complete len:248 (-) Transcript_11027:802-1545(-)
MDRDDQLRFSDMTSMLVATHDKFACLPQSFINHVRTVADSTYSRLETEELQGVKMRDLKVWTEEHPDDIIRAFFTDVSITIRPGVHGRASRLASKAIFRAASSQDIHMEHLDAAETRFLGRGTQHARTGRSDHTILQDWQQPGTVSLTPSSSHRRHLGFQLVAERGASTAAQRGVGRAVFVFARPGHWSSHPCHILPQDLWVPASPTRVLVDCRPRKNSQGVQESVARHIFSLLAPFLLVLTWWKPA